MKLLDFEQALITATKYNKKHVLLGNGFSIACRPEIFVYERLLKQADFGELSKSARKAFDALGTQDFERVIKALRDATALLALYDDVPDELITRLRQDADGLGNLLVETLANSHPEWPGEILDNEYTACRSFLAHFDRVFTLNYDLLLYWALMHTTVGETPSCDDGFRKPAGEWGEEFEYVKWESLQTSSQTIWFLHGALHIFDAGTEVRKFTWINTGLRLIEQIRDALGRGYFPLFVAEGTSEEKLARIKHSSYLDKGWRSFAEIQGALFVFGHSLAANDEHYLELIERGKIEHLFVGVHGLPASAANKAMIDRANRMTSERMRKRPKGRSLEVSFFDASTAHVWGRAAE